MKIFLKNLDGSKLEIEVDPQYTVDDMKIIIEIVDEENVYPAARQILIHRGKILKAGTTLKENNVAENDSILVIESTNKSSGSYAEATKSDTTAETGTPEQDDELPPLSAAPNKLDILRNSRHFLPLRAMMVANSRTFVPILEALEKHNPKLVELICENAFDAFRLLYEPSEGNDNPLHDLDSEEDEAHPRNWTDEELMAIRRLETLGFNRDLVSEVFYSCNKDEVATAAFLLSHLKFED